MSYELIKPFTENERYDFIAKYNQDCFGEFGYALLIEETDEALYALEYNEIMIDGKPTINENYEQEQAQKEKERVNKLTCTKRVFALMLQELGITYSQLKELIASNEQAQLEWDLCVELERGNPLLDIMAFQLGITSVQLDGLFKYANGEITLEQFKGII